MKVRWTRRADRSLRLLGDYIAKDNPQAAYKTVLKIRAAGNRLAENPAMGRLGRVKGTRELYYVPQNLLQNNC